MSSFFDFDHYAGVDNGEAGQKPSIAFLVFVEGAVSGAQGITSLRAGESMKRFLL